MAKKKARPETTDCAQTHESQTDPLFKPVIGQVIDPSKLGGDWSIEESSKGYSIDGRLTRRTPVSRGDLLELGVFLMDASALPANICIAVETDKDYKIISVELTIYICAGIGFGKPMSVEVTDSDKEDVVKEIESFLVDSKPSGRLVEDKEWLESTTPRFQEVFFMSKESPRYVGKTISYQDALANGWIVDKAKTQFFGFIELITDLNMPFWLGILVKADKKGTVSKVKCVLSDNGPLTMKQAQYGLIHELVDEFNYARLTRILDAVIHE